MIEIAQRRFRVDIRKKFVTESAIKPWQRLPRAMIELPSLKASEKSADVAPGDMV